MVQGGIGRDGGKWEIQEIENRRGSAWWIIWYVGQRRMEILKWCQAVTLTWKTEYVVTLFTGLHIREKILEGDIICPVLVIWHPKGEIDQVVGYGDFELGEVVITVPETLKFYTDKVLYRVYLESALTGPAPAKCQALWRALEFQRWINIVPASGGDNLIDPAVILNLPVWYGISVHQKTHGSSPVILPVEC